MASVMLLIAAAAAALPAMASDPVPPSFPWGIHLTYGTDPTTTMQVMWSTRAQVGPAVVFAGLSKTSLSLVFNGTETEFTDSGNTQYLKHATMSGLEPGSTYFYLVTDGNGHDSPTFHFHTFGADPTAPVTFAIFGDMGVDVNAHATTPLLIADAAAGKMDVVLHIGDIAYDLDTNSGANGDEFVVMTQNYSAYIPTHFCPGNHEDANDFAQYRARFGDMPDSTGDSTYHSFNVGPVHVVMFSSEMYFTIGAHGLGMLGQQYAWLEADLAAVDRAVTPWVVTMAHQPLYCSPNDDEDDCHSVLSLIRDGILGAYGVEALLYKYGVDVHFGAHEHAYERNYPVYQYQWNANVTGAAAYVNPDRPIHILTGAAGNPENQDPWQSSGNPFSATRVNDYGYVRFSVANATHALCEAVSDVGGGTIVDAMWFVQTRHGPFTSGLDAAPAAARVAAFEATLAFNRGEARPHAH